MAKHIGIVAVSAEGAALCYETICREGASLMGRHLHPEISMHTFPLARYVEFLESSDWPGLGRLMALSARKLIDAGAEIIICPDNTNHLGYDEATAEVEATWLHIAGEVAAVAGQAGYVKVGVLGTKFLMECPIYPQKLEAHNIKSMVPPHNDREELNRIIFDELVNGDFRPETRSYVSGLIDKLRTRGCDAVILGCTELPLLVDANDSKLPTLDSTRILARAALTESLAYKPTPTT
jgi:aspartate racemase